MLLATRCPVCGAHGPAPCRSCAAGLRPAPSLAVPAGLDALAVLLAYEGVGRELVARLKYRNGRAAVPSLAGAMAAIVGPLIAAVGGVDVVTWAPTAAVRRRARGFDQAELLARAIGRELVVPARALLARAHGPPQTGRPAAARRSGPSFAARGPSPPHVLLVDDVVTTGGTITAAARALRRAGAETLIGLAAARTPLKPRAVGADTAT